MPIEVRREQALDAALRLITERGYGSLTMEAIARAADLAKPVLYNAYPDLGALLLALLTREQVRALSALAAAMPQQPADADDAARLRYWATSLAEAIAANPAPWRLILIPPAGTPSAVRDHVEVGRAFALQQIRTLLGRMLERVRGAGTLDLELTAHVVLAGAEQAARLLVEDPARFPPERLVAYADSMLRALRPD